LVVAPIVIVVGAVAILGGRAATLAKAAANSEGDTRGWHELPRQLLFMPMKLPPGEYRLVSTPLDALARVLPAQKRQVDFEVEAGKPNLVLVNSPWTIAPWN
jgi:hypothetical protein